MIRASKYFIILLLFLAGCQEERAFPETAEDTLRQYQSYIDNNDFVNARLLSTPKEQARLVELEKIINEEVVVSQSESSLLHTIFHSIKCEKKEMYTECICELEDEYERYKQLFRLVQKDKYWLVDAPDEEIIINDEVLLNVIDSLKFPIDSLEF